MSIFSDFGITESAFTALVFLYLALFLIIFLISAVLFYLKGYGIYKMCRKLEIKGKWRGFVPFLNVWAIGDLAAVGNAKKIILKKLLTIFYLGMIFFSALSAIVSVSPLVKLLFAADIAVANGTELNPDIFYSFNLTFVLIIIAFICCLIYRIARIICCFNIYKVFSSKNAVIFTALAIIFPVLEPFFIYSASSNEPFSADKKEYTESETGFHIYNEE